MHQTEPTRQCHHRIQDLRAQWCSAQRHQQLPPQAYPSTNSAETEQQSWLNAALPNSCGARKPSCVSAIDSNAAFLSIIELFCQWHYLPRDAKSLHQIPLTCLRHWIKGLTEAYKKCCSGLVKVRHLLKNLSQGKDLVDSGKTRSKATGSIPAFAMQYIVDSKAKCVVPNPIQPNSVFALGRAVGV